MAVIKVGNNSIGKISVIEPYDDPFGNSVETPEPWVRPSNWLDMPVISSGEYVSMLIAIPSGDNEHYSFYLRGALDSNNYYRTDMTVDWGDGTVERSGSYTNNTSNQYHRVYHKYNFEDLPQESEITYGGRAVRQAIFTAVAHSGFDNISINDAYQRYNPEITSNSYASSRVQNRQQSNVLEIDIVSQSGRYLRMGNNYRAYGNLHKASINMPSTIDMYSWFDHCYNLRELIIPSGSTSNVTDMYRAFVSCDRLTELPFFDTSNVTNAYAAFNAFRSLQSMPNYDLSNVQNCESIFGSNHKIKNYPDFDLSNATTLRHAFSYNYKLESVDNITFNDSATNHNFMFAYCTRLKTYPPTLNFNLSDDCQSVFFDCHSLSLVPNKINVSNARYLDSMFHNCLRLPSVEVINTGTALRQCQSMFRNMGTSCITTTNIKLTGWENLPNLNYASSMFSYCRQLVSAPFLDTSNVIDLNSFFGYCYELKDVPHYDTSSATRTDSMFSQCYLLRKVPEFNLSNCTNAQSMFQTCRLLENIPSGLFDVERCSHACYECNGLTEIPSGVIFRQTNNSTQASYNFFGNCIRLSDFQNMGGFASGCNTNNMFRTNIALTEFPDSDGSQFSDSAGMFNYCHNLERCGLSGVKTSIGFYDCLLGSGALYEIINNLASGVTSKTLDVRENYGVGFLHPDTLAIATSKGWTVTT